jgi:putative glutamine amidotransferase
MMTPMNRPVIGITCSMEYRKEGRKYPTSQTFDYINRSYYEAVDRSGGFPIILPNSKRKISVRGNIELVDGLLVSGGNDVDPKLYGERKKAKNLGVTRERDLFEIALVRNAKANRVPVLAICRGMQLVNVAFGGSLYQDFSFGKGFLDHTLEGSTVYYKKHPVVVEEDSRLYNIIGKKRVMVNTSHHQMVKKVAPGFVAAAHSERDGVIEAIESKDDHLILCVQWHPELMKDRSSKALFDWLIQSAKGYRSKKSSGVSGFSRT